MTTKRTPPQPSKRVDVLELQGRFLLAPEGSRDQAELVAALAPGTDDAIVVVAADSEAMWARLAGLLGRLPHRRLVLAMSGAATGTIARRIADGRRVTVVAPTGDVILVPGGTMFVHAGEWRSFAPGAEPVSHGPRWPEKGWSLPPDAEHGGFALTQAPAGVLVRPAGTRVPADIAYAVPAGEDPAVLVTGDPTPEDLTALLRGGTPRLVPIDGRDLLPLGQALARQSENDVEVLTGPPVCRDGERRVVLLDADGRPTWSPYVASVLCRPDGPPRIQDRRPLDVDVRDGWRVTPTRAGLWLHPEDAPEPPVDAYPPAPDAVRLDVTGPVDEPVLEELLGQLPHARLTVHGTATANLREHTARHEAMLEEPGITPAHRSTDEERAAFRAMVGLGWDSHAAPVRRTFGRLPAIGAGERAAAAIDLVAVRLYLTGEEREDRPYLACLASGLARLPTYRGAVVRGAEAYDAVEPGVVLTEPGPVGGRPLANRTKPDTAALYLIWSDTARRVAALLDKDQTDVVFAPGTRFLVLDVRRGDPDLVFLREITAEETPPTGRLALTRLDEALGTAATDTSAWPAHCTGPISRAPVTVRA